MRDKQNTATSTLSIRRGECAMSHATTPGLRAIKSKEWTLSFGKDSARRASPHPKSATTVLEGRLENNSYKYWYTRNPQDIFNDQ